MFLNKSESFVVSQRIDLALVSVLFARHLKIEVSVIGAFFSGASQIYFGYRKVVSLVLCFFSDLALAVSICLHIRLQFGLLA